jgi:hypothetical protein
MGAHALGLTAVETVVVKAETSASEINFNLSRKTISKIIVSVLKSW